MSKATSRMVAAKGVSVGQWILSEQAVQEADIVGWGGGLFGPAKARDAFEVVEHRYRPSTDTVWLTLRRSPEATAFVIEYAADEKIEVRMTN